MSLCQTHLTRMEEKKWAYITLLGKKKIKYKEEEKEEKTWLKNFFEPWF